MTTRRSFAFAGAAGLLTSALTVRGQDLQRGLRNYREIIAGKKKLEQLTPQERSEVLLIARRMKTARTSGKTPECREALERAEEAASDLATSSRRLASCAAAEDYEDDCSSEFSRVRSDHSDYEDAVSEVESNCN